MALAFGLDVSTSVDAEEHRMQRRGLAAALISSSVRDAILNRPAPIVLLAYEWSGSRGNQDILVPWSRITSHADLEAFASSVVKAPRYRDDLPTGLGAAIGMCRFLEPDDLSAETGAARRNLNVGDLVFISPDAECTVKTLCVG